MAENRRINLTDKQKEAVAEQLAGFFFNFWNSRNTNEQKNKKPKKESIRTPHKG